MARALVLSFIVLAACADLSRVAVRAPSAVPSPAVTSDTRPAAPAAKVAAPVASGTYESYSPIELTPVAPITQARAAQLLGHWLEVETVGNTTTVVFAPERVLSWTLTYGPRGLERKVSAVDGAAWTTSNFVYDASGHVVTKIRHRQGEREVFVRHGAGRRVVERVSVGAKTRETWSVHRSSAMNEPSELVYDATGLLQSAQARSICGFCVAMDTPPIGGVVLGTDEHWTRGPWVRLDDTIDVIADHHVLTPGGSRPAGELRAGDVVLGDSGPRRLRSVQSLEGNHARRGVNVRARSGSFSAGGFRFVSEQGRDCR